MEESRKMLRKTTFQFSEGYRFLSDLKNKELLACLFFSVKQNIIIFSLMVNMVDGSHRLSSTYQGINIIIFLRIFIGSQNPNVCIWNLLRSNRYWSWNQLYVTFLYGFIYLNNNLMNYSKNFFILLKKVEIDYEFFYIREINHKLDIGIQE